MWMAWGPELTFFCNDAYRRDTLGKKYPWALGRPAREVWAEIWPDIGPRIEAVMRTGVATWDEALLLFLERSGYVEETYHTFSYSPLTDDDGRIAGMLCVVSEDTERRDRRAPDGDAARPRVGRDDAHARAEVLRPPRRAPRRQPARPAVHADLPVRRGRRARPRAAAGIAPTPGTPGRPGRPGTRAGRARRRSTCRRGAWDEPPVAALLLPLPQQGQGPPTGFLVAGLNRYRPLDDDYRGFLELVAGQIAAGHRQRARVRGRAPAARRRWPSSTAPRPRSSPTSATSCARR